MKRKWNDLLWVSVCLFLLSGMIMAEPAGGNRGGHGTGPNNNGYWPYPTIDLTNGIPPWVTNYNNNTTSAPQAKGEYVSSYDNTTQNGKIYYQTYSQTGTGVTIATVPKGKQNQQQQQQPTSNTVTYGTDKN